MTKTGFFASLFGLEKGVHPPYNKNTAECATIEMPVPERIFVSMQQHVGAPCEPVVAKGDTVAVGQVVGDSDKAISAPIHSSMSGKVAGFTELTMPGGMKVPALEIHSDGEQRIFEGIEAPKINSKADMVAAIRASGLVGLGGAGFPTHVKFALAETAEIDTLIINGAECEPFITADYRECMENSWDVMNGIVATAEHFGVKRTIIMIENNKPLAIEELSRIAATISSDSGQNITVKSIPAMYPQGAEKIMVERATGRKIPVGKLPSDVGCVVMNITSTAFVSRYLKDGMPLISRRLTVDGSGIANPGNFQVLLGTPIKDLIAAAGGYVGTPGKILMGGPMMGLTIFDDNMPVLKQNNAILVFAADEIEPDKELPCIRCGRCVAACPMQLSPPAVALAYKLNDPAEMNKKNVASCIECGCCSYICPAKRPLVQTMRLAKAAVRKAGMK